MIEVIVGCVSSGKTSELIRRITRAKIAKKNVLAFKPIIDDRYKGANFICSHDGASFPAIAVESPVSLLIDVIKVDLVDRFVDLVAIEEIQFFPQKIVDIVSYMADAGKTVIVSGLDLNFRGQPFGPIPQLMAIAERVDKLSAVCVLCGRDGTRTQRLIEGKPAPKSGPEIQVGDLTTYRAVCRSCYNKDYGIL